MSPFCVLRFVSPCSLFPCLRIFSRNFASRSPRSDDSRWARPATSWFFSICWLGLERSPAEPGGRRVKGEAQGQANGARAISRARGGSPEAPTSVSQWLPPRVRPPLPPWAVASAAPQFPSSQEHDRDTRCGCRRAALRRPAPCSAPGHNGGRGRPVRLYCTVDLLPPQFLHHPVLMRAVHPLDSSLGFRRTRGDHRDPQLRAHALKLRDRFFPS